MRELLRVTAGSLILMMVLSLNVFASGITWVSHDPGSPEVDVPYDFRPTIMRQPNWISGQEQNLARASLQMWSSVSNVNFVQNQSVPDTSILTIGVTPMDGRWNVLGRGGYRYTNAGGFWHISSGVAALDATENWDLRIGNRDRPGTLDFFTVLSHEIGHALGLDHSSNPDDVMYPYYMGARSWLSAGDIQNVQGLYGGGGGSPNGDSFAAVTMVPEPGTAGLILTASALAGLLRATRHRRVMEPTSSTGLKCSVDRTGTSEPHDGPPSGATGRGGLHRSS